jgi:predicted amino acid racemase
MRTPSIEINLSKLKHNAKIVIEMCKEYGISVTAVTKVDLGETHIAKALVEAGITIIGDSRIEDIIKMKDAGIEATYMLIRSPFLSDIKRVVSYADISLNTEVEIIKALSKEAKKQEEIHKIILMLEMGDRREGILPEYLISVVQKVVDLPNIELVGIGANFACFGGVKPNQEKMNHLSLLVEIVEQQFKLKLSIISGGNSANFEWLQDHSTIGRINNLRLGESIFLGVETLHRNSIEGLYQDIFTLTAEVIERKMKPSLPNGEIALNAFGEMPKFEDRGTTNRAILGIGREDIDIDGLMPYQDVDILGGSSDHTILDSKESGLEVGDLVKFNLNYTALLRGMISPFVNKVFKEEL